MAPICLSTIFGHKGALLLYKRLSASFPFFYLHYCEVLYLVGK